jgi:hypothetical protein
MWIATWNVRTMYRAGAMDELIKEMDKYAMQEISWPGIGTVMINNYLILYRGHKSDKHEFETAFHISKHIVDNLSDFKSVSEECVKLLLNLNITV